MAPQKLPKNQLASEHLLVTKKEKSVIKQMAKKQGVRISDMVLILINHYANDMANDFERFVINQ